MAPAPKSQRRNPVVCHGHTRPVVDVSYSNVTPDGYFLASASKDGSPMLRHGESGDWYGTFQGHKGAVWSCVLNQPALLCATGAADFTARVWDACTGNQIHELPHKHIVRTTAFSHKTNKLATGGMEKIIRVYDLEDVTNPQMFPAQPSGVRGLTWLGNDNTLLCSYTDSKGIGVIDVQSQNVVKTLETDAPVLSMELSYDGKYLTTADGSSVRIFDTSSLSPIYSHKVKPGNAESASYCALKGVFAAGGTDMWVRLYDVQTGQELECNKGHHGPVHAVRFSPTYDCFASGSEDGTIRIWYMDGADTNVVTNGSPAVLPVNGVAVRAAA